DALSRSALRGGGRDDRLVRDHVCPEILRHDHPDTGRRLRTEMRVGGRRGMGVPPMKATLPPAPSFCDPMGGTPMPHRPHADTKKGPPAGEGVAAWIGRPAARWPRTRGLLFHETNGVRDDMAVGAGGGDRHVAGGAL